MENGGHIVLELNGAVDFDERYSLAGGDAYIDAAAALQLFPAQMSATSASESVKRSPVRIFTD